MCTYEMDYVSIYASLWTQCNQRCDQEHWNTCISHYWWMPWKICPPNCTNMFHGQCYCSLTYRLNNKLQLLFTVFLRYMCQQQIWPYNTTYMPIHSCAHETTMQVYIPRMNSLNEQCDQEHWYAHIPHYWNLPLDKHVYHITHIVSTALPLQSTWRSHITTHISKKQQVALTYHFITLYVPETNTLLKCHICATCLNYLTCINGDVYQYVCHIQLTGINHVTRSDVHLWCWQHRSPITLAELAIGQISQKWWWCLTKWICK